MLRIFLLLISLSVVFSEVDQRIINGKPVSKIEWALTRPWLVQNVCDYNDGNGWVTCGCSSTIINSRFLITAGHCLNAPYTYGVGLKFSNGRIITNYAEIHTPNWEYGPLELKELCGIRVVIQGDVGLQYLDKDIDFFGWGVQPFPGFFRKVPAHFPTHGTIEGWGATTEQGAVDFYDPTFATQLQKLEENVFANADCQAKVNGWLDVLYEVSGGLSAPCSFTFNDNLVCAGHKNLADIQFSYDESTFGYPADPTGICLGDSGSPLYDWTTNRILGFVSDTLSTSPVGPCGYGLDIYTKLTQEIVDWVRSEVYKKGMTVVE